MPKTFPERLIEGRIAETVFEQMFREGTKFDVYPLGYEHTIPALSQARMHIHEEETKAILTDIIDNFSDTPDFLLIKPDKSEIFVVEVKYRAEKKDEEIKAIAKEISLKWKKVWIFLATQDGFYFDNTNNILYHKPEIPSLGTNWISQPLQRKYLNLIKEFGGKTKF